MVVPVLKASGETKAAPFLLYSDSHRLPEEMKGALSIEGFRRSCMAILFVKAFHGV